MTRADWTISGPSGVSGSYLVSGAISKYVLRSGATKHSLYWVGAGLSVSVPGLPASGGISTPSHWCTTGRVYFSELAPHRLNPRYHRAESVFTGQGVIVEAGANSALVATLGLLPMLHGFARRQGIQDYENQIAAQILLINTTWGITGMVTGMQLADLISILTELALRGQFSSIYTKALAFSASTSTGVDTGGVGVQSGSWLLW